MVGGASLVPGGVRKEGGWEIEEDEVIEHATARCVWMNFLFY
jgi:hypothetical protein